MNAGSETPEALLIKLLFVDTVYFGIFDFVGTWWIMTYSVFFDIGYFGVDDKLELELEVEVVIVLVIVLVLGEGFYFVMMLVKDVFLYSGTVTEDGEVIVVIVDLIGKAGV